jgi:hypothetical protein
MQLKVFQIPAGGCEATEAELNRFLRTHRVLQVDRALVLRDSAPCWAVCVEYAAAADAWNFRKWMRESIFGRIFALFRTLFPAAKPATGASASLFQYLSCLLKMVPAGS